MAGCFSKDTAQESKRLKMLERRGSSQSLVAFGIINLKSPGGRRVWRPELSNYFSPGCVTKGRGSSVPKSHCTPVFMFIVTRASLGASQWMEG